MSDDLSPRLALPLLDAGQAQKEITHNEALTLLDLLTQTVVVAAGVNVPPEAPVAGQCWIVGTKPDGAWSGSAQALAGWSESGWRFCLPVPGMCAWSLADGAQLRFDGTGWNVGILRAAGVEIGGVQVVGERQPAIAEPTGGTVIDAEARSVLASVVAALHNHGLIGT
jgi:hypothetical protein